MTIVYITIAAALFLLIFIIGTANSLIRRRNEVKNAYSTVNVHCKQRYDLIPNLVDCVQRYMKHEKEVLEKLTALRTSAVGSKMDYRKTEEINNEISSAIRTLMFNAENYPELKSSGTFLQLQESLTDIEENIAAARRTFNMAVTGYNNLVQMFPSNIIARSGGFKKYSLFKATEAERQNIDVGKLFNR